MTREIPLEDHLRQQIKFTTCYMCACRCGIKVTLEDGKVRFIQGTRNHPVNQGVLCAKGASGIMKQYSPAKLGKPLKRRSGAERGSGDFVEIEWSEALDILTARLAKIRATDPTKLAFFTGRDQMQALSHLWAQQFGTPNWAAHGGFCSVNMAVAGLYTNAPWLVVQTPGMPGDGLFARDAEGHPLVWDQEARRIVNGHLPDIAPALLATVDLPDGRRAKTVHALATERYLDERYAPSRVAAECGVPAESIERIALEMAHVAFNEAVELPIQWTDMHGRSHDKVVGRPVAMHAMRGISAHSNGFQTCRALHLLQMLLGALDGPGNFRARAPYPRRIPMRTLPENDPKVIFAPNTPLSRTLYGYPTRPEELVIDKDGKPLRIDRAYSWESPLAAHGLMHMVITNAVNRDPYAIDTLLLFMANMAWNSTMNTGGVREMLVKKDKSGEYVIPFLVVVDTFHSETVGFADLVLPDTTYLERYDTISLLDRPISEPDAAADAIRQPVVETDRDVRPWQEVLIELASRLELPAFTHADGTRKFRDYKDFIVNYEKVPGIGLLAGWRGKHGAHPLRREPNPKQWERYAENQCYFAYPWPENMRYYRYANKDYLEFAEKHALFGTPPVQVILQMYSEPLQKFRLAGRGDYAGPKPTSAVDRERLATYFDPLPFWYE